MNFRVQNEETLPDTLTRLTITNNSDIKTSSRPYGAKWAGAPWAGSILSKGTLNIVP